MPPVHPRPHFIVNSNKWFSAVSDYALQLGGHFVSEGHPVMFVSHPTSPNIEKAKNKGMLPIPMPLLPGGVLAFLRSWALLSALLRAHAPQGVWVFEGREHTLAALHKRLRPGLWKNTLLIRVRGQAQSVKGHAMNRWVYNHGVDGVVLASEALRQRFAFPLRASHTHTQLYLAAVPSAPSPPQLPPEWEIDPKAPLFSVVGRFDPVKGHEALIRAFASATWPPPSKAAHEAPHVAPPLQMVFLGESKNIAALDLARSAALLMGAQPPEARPHQGCLLWSVQTPHKTLLLVEGLSPHAASLMALSHWGLIPSLGSEVICRVAVEYQSRGTPVIASSVGTLPEVADLCLPPADEQAWRRALEEKAAQALLTPETDAQRSHRALLAAQRWNPSAWTRLWEKLVKSKAPTSERL